jgi:hypothetical protein
MTCEEGVMLYFVSTKVSCRDDRKDAAFIPSRSSDDLDGAVGLHVFPTPKSTPSRPHKHFRAKTSETPTRIRSCSLIRLDDLSPYVPPETFTSSAHSVL